jgi:hypothetical protein
MSRFRRRLMGLAALRQAAADDFVRVEYIQNPSKAYINTLYRPSNNTSVEVKLKYIENLVQWKFVYGVEQPTHRFSFLKQAANAGHPFRFDFGTTTNAFDYELVLNQLLTIKQDRNKLYIDDILIGESTFISSFRTPYNLYIFTCNQKGRVNEVYNNQQIRLYGFKIWENNVLIRDYIPMYQISTDTYGLWDRVTKEFYVSPNGTKFIGGHQIIYDAEISYLRGTDPQYIDTGIIPNDSTGVYLKAYRDAGSDNFVIGCRNGGGNTRWAIGKISTSGWYYGWGKFESSSIEGNPADIYLNYKNDRLFKVTASDGTKTQSLPSLPFTPAYNIRLFGSAGVNANYTKWNGRIYAVQITQGTEIIMDLIPVRVGNVGYMYDKVSNKLFGNNGSGSFILGQDTVVYDKI